MSMIPAILWTSAIKATIVLIAACLAAFALRLASASTRRLVWALAVAGLIALPVLSVVVPAIGISKLDEAPPQIIADSLPAPTTAEHRVLSPAGSAKPSAAPVSWASILWAAGVLAVFGRLAAGTSRIWWMARSAKPIEAPSGLKELLRAVPVRRKVTIVESDVVAMPMTWGVVRPVILMPAAWRQWPVERTRLVLAHELIHIRQQDCLIQMLSQAACALYWFHPLAWLAAARFRKEREHACDDGVLNLGVNGPHYAEHLLELVRTLKDNQRPWSLAVAMAQHSHLESRLVALLDARLNRTGVTRRAIALAGVALLCLLAPLAALHAQAPQATGTIFGAVYDASGAVIPGAKVMATNVDASTKEMAVTGPAGEYSLKSLPAGRYAVEVSVPGFKIFHRNGVVLRPNASERLDIAMDIGSIVENVEVIGKKPGTSPIPNNSTPKRIRVGGNVQAAQLLTKVQPVYPEHARQQGIQGQVLMQAIISKEGEVLSLSVRNTADAELAQAAKDAVVQWHYRPTLLNGQPVEVVTTVTVDFRLEP